MSSSTLLIPCAPRAGECARRGWPSCRSSRAWGRTGRASGRGRSCAADVEVGRAEAEVVLEEVDVRIHVRHHELLIDERVALEQIGVRRVVVDDHLVDLREAVLVALGEPLVLHAEAPVRVAVREAPVRRDLVHLVVREDLEDHREEVQARLGGELWIRSCSLRRYAGARSSARTRSCEQPSVGRGVAGGRAAGRRMNRRTGPGTRKAGGAARDASGCRGNP